MGGGGGGGGEYCKGEGSADNTHTIKPTSWLQRFQSPGEIKSREVELGSYIAGWTVLLSVLLSCSTAAFWTLCNFAPHSCRNSN